MLDLEKNTAYVGLYVFLRNQYIKELMTQPVTVKGTLEWLKENKGTILVHLEDGRVVSAVIIHNRQEVTVFSSVKGMGDTMLKEAEVVARAKGYNHLWARTLPDNKQAQALFLRNGYTLTDGIFKKDIYCFREGSDVFPRMIVLSLVYVCNARCRNCPYNNSTIRETYRDALLMPSEIFKRIADEAGPYGTVLRLSGGGEPFLHREIDELTAYATDRGCKVSIITNGSKSVIGVLDVADMIEFSVDAGTKEEYSVVRPGLDWGILNNNIMAALENRKKTRLICSVINQTGVDIEQAKSHWNMMDTVQIRKYLTWGYNEDRSADPTPYLPPEKRIPCPWLFERLNIDSRGDVTYCGEDIAFKHKFANIKNRTIKDIWQGIEFGMVRKAHLERNGDVFEMCRNCPDWKYRTWDYNYFKLRADADSHQST